MSCRIVKKIARYEIVNDKNDKLVNFLSILCDRPDDLYKACETLPYSESFYEKYKWEAIQDPFEQAVRFFYIVRAGFSGGGHKYKTGFSISVTQVASKVNSYYSSVELIKDMAARIKNWNILCRDFEDVTARYDSRDTFFFIDSPYVGFEDLYEGGFTRQDHYRLIKTLENLKGKAMVCYYDNPLEMNFIQIGIEQSIR